MTQTLIIPGLKSSGPLHWQTWLQRRVEGAIRVHQRDWNAPHLPDWSGRVRAAIIGSSSPVHLVAHSFGALAAVQAASDHEEQIAGALIVAPADPDRFGVRDYLPHHALGFPAIVVASQNDPWMPIAVAERWATRWRADFVDLGLKGHINAESGFGPWPEALKLLERLSRANELIVARENRAALRQANGRRWGESHLAGRRVAGIS
ncbi:MAG: RBBP9/YdeN family alpha/beta hydrolase [Hyphomicrobium sp.]